MEEKLNNNIKEEVQKVTDPMKNELTKLLTENKTLKSEVAMLKAKQKEDNERSEKIVKAIKEHQVTLARHDKANRFKRLLLSGVPEEPITINDVRLENDKEKVEEILKTIQANDVVIADTKRIGAKDQGAQKRPRYILLEFVSSNDRNRVKKEGEKLKQNDDTKTFFFKADKTKKEREEYKKLYNMKEQLEKEDGSKVVEIKYGKLYVDEICVATIETENDFLF